MRIFSRWLLLSLLSFGLTGCLESTVQVELNKDGSGKVTYHEFFSPQITQMMEGFAASMPKSAATTAAPADPLAAMFKDNIQKRLTELGPGAALISNQTKTNSAGWKGYIAIYSFKDINNVAIHLGDSKDESSGGPSNDTPVKFKLTPGNVATLQILPRKEAPPAKPAGSTPAPEDANAAMMQAMAPMLKGMHMAVSIKVNGAITETNARYVDKPSTVTLLDVEMDKLIANPEAMKFIGSKNPEDSKQLIKLNIPGIKLEEEDKTLSISFK